MGTAGRYRRTRRAVYTDSYSGVWNGLLALGLLIGAGFIIYIFLGQWIRKHMEGEPAGAPSPAARKSGSPGSGPAAKGSGASKPSGNRPAPPAAPAPAPSSEMPLNVAVLAKEICRYRNDGSGVTRLENSAVYHRSRYVEETRAQEKVPDHLEPFDEIVAIDDIDLRKMSGEDAASTLRNHMQKIPGGTYLKFRVLRVGAEKEFHVYFPPSTSIAEGGGAVPERIKITNALALEIQREVLSLPPQHLSDGERSTIERCLGRGEATAEEYSLITRRLARGASATVRKEDEAFKAKIADLEKRLAAAEVPDAIVTKDGRTVLGKVLEDSGSGVVVEAAIGKITLPRAEVRYVQNSAALREEFKNKLASAENNPEAWSTLLKWTKDWGLDTHREYVAHRMLVMDPDDRMARMAAGYFQGQDGQWVAGLPRPVTRKPANRAEMQKELEDLGFVLKDGKWFSRTAWTAAIDNLHAKADLKVALNGTAIMAGREGDTPLARLFNPTAKPKPGEEIRERFIAPTAAAGTATVTVEAPGEIIECQVKASGAVLERAKQGKLEVYLVTDKPKLLYLIDGGANADFHEVSADLRGRKRFSVQARLTTTVDKYHTYARFLPCVPETKEVFCVRARILQPAPDIDKAWAAAK